MKEIAFIFRGCGITRNVLDRVNKYWKTTGTPRTDRYPVKNQVSARSGHGFSNMIPLREGLSGTFPGISDITIDKNIREKLRIYLESMFGIEN